MNNGQYEVKLIDFTLILATRQLAKLNFSTKKPELYTTFSTVNSEEKHQKGVKSKLVTR